MYPFSLGNTKPVFNYDTVETDCSTVDKILLINNIYNPRILECHLEIIALQARVYELRHDIIGK